MKLDLFTSIGVAIVGVLIGFFVTNLIVQPIGDFSFQSVDDSANGDVAKNGYNYANLTEPNPEVFNYDALNPTVEVYVGECEEYDDNGECVEDQEEADETTADDESDNNQDESNSESDGQENE